MAAPIAHIFCALFLLDSGAIEVENKSAFIVGTSFPDIRYLGVIDRDQTHVENLTWNDVKNASTSFEQGCLLHSLLDEEREKFVVKYNLYDCFPNSQFRTQILKFYEDILLYEAIKNWPEIADYFNNIFSEESVYGIKKNDLILWHNLLKQYLLHCPDVYQIFLFLQQRTTFKMQQEANIIKKFFIQCAGAVLNRMAYIKLTLMLQELKKSKKLKDGMMFFYKNIHRFLVKN
jgi:hypothetical protein